MTLKEWINLNGMTMAEISRQIGISRQSIEQYINYGTIPSIANMKKIAEFTRQQVKPDDFYAPWFMQGG